MKSRYPAPLALAALLFALAPAPGDAGILDWLFGGGGGGARPATPDQDRWGGQVGPSGEWRGMGPDPRLQRPLPTTPSAPWRDDTLMGPRPPVRLPEPPRYPEMRAPYPWEIPPAMRRPQQRSSLDGVGAGAEGALASADPEGSDGTQFVSADDPDGFEGTQFVSSEDGDDDDGFEDEGAASFEEPAPLAPAAPPVPEGSGVFSRGY